MWMRTGTEDYTDQNAEVTSYHMQSGNVRNTSHDTADTGQDGSKTNDGVERGNSLGEISGSNALANQSTYFRQQVLTGSSNGRLTSENTQGCEATKLRQDLGREPGGEQTSENTGGNTEHTEHVAHACSGLRGETRNGTNAED